MDRTDGTILMHGATRTESGTPVAYRLRRDPRTNELILKGAYEWTEYRQSGTGINTVVVHGAEWRDIPAHISELSAEPFE